WAAGSGAVSGVPWRRTWAWCSASNPASASPPTAGSAFR
ncbi:MAG: Iron-sulfur cluster-binding protein, partial [uncultured Cytophagales bacterium]